MLLRHLSRRLRSISEGEALMYFVAHTEPTVGFRPNHKTDPYAASHLSGMSSGNFFRQAFLHGLSDGLDPMLAELVAQGHMTTAEAEAIQNGSMSFQDVTGVPDPSENSSWDLTTALFSQVNDRLFELEQMVDLRNPEVANAIGKDVILARTKYAQLAATYIEAYGTVMGSTPQIPGLGGLGLGPVILGVGLVSIFFTVWLGLYTLLQLIESRLPIANAAAAQAQAEAIKTSEQKGDTTTALELAKKAPNQPSNAFAWFEANWMSLAFAAGALVISGPLVEGLFGKPRRRNP